MFAKLKQAATRMFDRVVEKLAGNLPDPVQSGPVLGAVAHGQAKMPSFKEVFASWPAHKQLAWAAMMKRPGFRGPTPQKRLRGEKARAARLAATQ